MTSLKYISYATPDYLPMLKSLHKSMTAVGIDKSKIEFSTVEQLGDWRRNVALKPEFMLKKCKENPNTNYAWIDADAVVMSPLVWFEKFKGFWGMANEYVQSHSRGFLSNAYIVRSCPATWKLLEAWAHESHVVIRPPHHSRTPTQTAFKRVWYNKDNDWGFDITEVPTGYVWYEPHKKREPYKSTIPIIKHDIASRKMIHRRK